MWYDLNDSPIVEENRRVGRERTLFSLLIAFFVLTIVTDFAVSLPMTVFLMFRLVGDFSELFTIFANNDIAAMEAYITEVSAEKGYLFASLLSTAAGIAVLLFFAFRMEKRTPYSLGFTKKNAVPLYAVGFVAGIALLAASVGVATLNGSVSLAPAGEVSWLWIFLFLIGFIIQGAFEEILLRGVFFPALLRHFPSPLVPCLVSAAFFSAMHGANPGVSPIAFLNIFLFGALLSLLMLRTGSILPCLALHSAWNFAEGCLFGSAVSGLPALPSILVSTLDPNKALTSGGVFGPEGGVAVTLVLVVALAAVILIGGKKKPIVEAHEE